MEPTAEATAGVAVSERVVLKKFRGNDMTQEPVEAIVMVDGKTVDRWRAGDDRPCPED